MAKTVIGTMACEGQNCKSHDRGQVVLVKENDRGTLSYCCDWCGRAPYAKVGTGQHAEWRAAIKPIDPPAAAQPAPVAAPKPAAPAPDAKPAAPVKRAVLDLGAL